MLISENEIRVHLNDLLSNAACPFDGFYMLIERASPFVNLEFGRRGTGDPNETKSLSAFGPSGTTCKIEVWVSASARSVGNALNLPEMISGVINLVKEYWQPDLRHSKFLLISRESDRGNLLEKTLLNMAGKGQNVALLYGDLDNFKAANDVFGEIVGDRVIREFGALVERAAGPDSIVIHRSGDTFAVLIPRADALKVLSLSWRFHELFTAHSFNVGDVKLGMKIGIAFSDAYSSSNAYADLEPVAQSATKDPGGQKLRGRARLAGKNPTELPPADQYNKDVAVALVKSNLSGAWTLSNPWLALISDCVREASSRGTEVDRIVTDLLEWIGFEFN